IILISSEKIKEVMADIQTKTTMKEFPTNDKANYYSGITCIMVNGKRAYELKGKFLDDLRDNAFSGTMKKTRNDYEGVADAEFSNVKEANNDDEQETAKIFRIKTNLFDYKTPLCTEFEEFNFLLKPWSEDGVPYEIYDHICEPFRFKNGKAKWPTCNSNEDKFCNGGELPGMVRVSCMTCFQDYEWYNELADGNLKEEALKCSLEKKSTKLMKYQSSGILYVCCSRAVIMEYLVKISKKACILEHKRRHLKKLTLTSYTPYPSRKIRRIFPCTSQKTTKIQDQYTLRWTRAGDPGDQRQGIFDEDVVDHIAKVLELLDLIKIPGVDSHRLRMKVFPLSLVEDARQWWINEGGGKITTWEELVEKFFCKDGEDEMLDEGDNLGIDLLEFISRVNSSFENHMKVDGRTKKVLFHSWMNGSWNKRRLDNNILSNKEWKESDYGIFKAHD
ncbi:hypothetical protein Tco_0548252, partial [Tanacetum coccineum]